MWWLGPLLVCVGGFGLTIWLQAWMLWPIFTILAILLYFLHIRNRLFALLMMLAGQTGWILLTGVLSDDSVMPLGMNLMLRWGIWEWLAGSIAMILSMIGFGFFLVCMIATVAGALFTFHGTKDLVPD